MVGVLVLCCFVGGFGFLLFSRAPLGFGVMLLWVLICYWCLGVFVVLDDWFVCDLLVCFEC